MEKKVRIIIKEILDDFFDELELNMGDRENELKGDIDTYKKMSTAFAANKMTDEKRAKDTAKKNSEEELKGLEDLQKNLDTRRSEYEKEKLSQQDITAQSTIAPGADAGTSRSTSISTSISV